MVKQRACKVCKTIHERETCPNCGSKDYTGGFKGKIVVFNPEASEITDKIDIKKKGTYAIKTR